MALMLAASMLFMNTNSSLFAKEEAKGEEISEQTDKTRQPSSISYAPTQQALLGSTPLEETKEEPKEETETPKTKEAVQTVEVKTTIYLDANKNEKKDKEEKGVSDIEVRLYKMQEGTAEKEASYQAITNIKGEVCLKDVETGSYRIEYESMDSEKDLKDYTIIQEKKDITKATDKEKELNKKTDIKKTEKENKTILYQEEVEIQEAKELEAALYKEEKEAEETKNGSKTETNQKAETKAENIEKDKPKVQQATNEMKTTIPTPAQLAKLEETSVGAAYTKEQSLLKAVREVFTTDDWNFNVYYIGQSDRHDIKKQNDFSLKYQVEFHNSRDMAMGEVVIRIPAILATDRNGNKILPNSIAVPEGTLENPVPNKITPFNYYLDEESNELVFFNYKDIISGSNVAFQVLYKNIDIMQLPDGTQWELTPSIQINEEQVETGAPLTGTIDSDVKLSSVIKSPYTLGNKSYCPGIYTLKQLESIVKNVPDQYKNNFSNYKFVAWKININGSATQPYDIYLKDLPTDGEIVGFNQDYKKISYDGDDNYYKIVNSGTDKTIRYSNIIVVTAYPTDAVETNKPLDNEVEVVLLPKDGKDKELTQTSKTSWNYQEYEWKYNGDLVGITKKENSVYKSWLEVYKEAKKQQKDLGDIPFHIVSETYGYELTHHATNHENQLGERKEGMSYRMTTVDDFLYAYPNRSMNGTYEILDSKDYYYNGIRIRQQDIGYDPWEDEPITPEGEQGMIVYAMFKDKDTWEKVAEIPWKANGDMEYTFTQDQLAREPWRVKVEHEAMDYRSTCTIDVKVRLRHDSLKMENLLNSDAGAQEITLENLAGAMAEKLDHGTSTGYLQDAIQANYEEPQLEELTKALYNTLPVRDNANAYLSALDKNAASYKYGTSWNEPVNGRVHLNYNITAYDGYEVYGSEAVSYLRERDLPTPGRKDVVFYDLLSYGVKYDPSVDIIAGRVKSADHNAVKYAKSWDQKDVSVSMDSQRDVITNYNGTGRTLLAFHIHYDGEDPAGLYSYGSDYLWMEGWGISFGAYYDWKDIDISNAATNISAFMPEQGDIRPLLGKDNQVMKDDGQEYPAGMKEEYQYFGEDINQDGITNIKNVLYAKAIVDDDMAIATSDNIEKYVKADKDRFGVFTESAVVSPSEGYTYEITVKNAKDILKNIVVYDLLEDAPKHRSEQEKDKNFEDNWWYGTFDGVITTGLEKSGQDQLFITMQKEILT